MEHEATSVKLKLDEDNSLVFEVKIEGEAPASAPVYRLVCETGEIAYSFRGQPSAEGVEFVVPSMHARLKEGSYDAHLEVIIENKLLIPLEFQAEFIMPTKVHVESVRVGGAPIKHQTVAPSAAAKLLRVDGPSVSKTISEAGIKKPTVKQPEPSPPPSSPITEQKVQVTKENKKHVTLREIFQKSGSK